MNFLKNLFTAVLLAAASSAWAGIPVPELLSTEPVEPRANQQFDFIYALEFCGDTFPGYTPQNRTVEVKGNIVRFTVLYALNSCFPGQPYPSIFHWRIGPLPPGDYKMELWGYNAIAGPENSFPVASGGEVTIAAALAAPMPNVIPAAGDFGLQSLALLTMLTAMWGIRRR